MLLQLGLVPAILAVSERDELAATDGYGGGALRSALVRIGEAPLSLSNRS
jgi:hypothetical protein